MCDLGTLKPESGHEAFLAEDEGVDIALKRRGGHGFGDAGINDDDAWADPDLPTITFVQVRESVMVHEKQRVAEFLDACLQAIRDSRGLVIARGFTVDEQHAFSALGAEDETGFDDIGEDEDGRGLVGDLGRFGIILVELAQGPLSISLQLIGAGGSKAR